MLYDIVPPLAFFASLAGIVFVVGRVVARLKRQQLSHAIQMEGLRSRESEELLGSNESKVTFMKNRLAAVGTSVGQSFTALRQLPTSLKERRAQKKELAEAKDLALENQIQAPRSSWREQLAAKSSGVNQGLRKLQSSLVSRFKKMRLPRPSRGEPQTRTLGSPAPLPPVSAGPRPAVSLRRVDTTETSAASRMETTAQRLQALVRTKRATTSPVQEAQAFLAKGQLNEAEDVIVPYIAKHPKNTAAYMLLADVALGRNAWDEAVEILEQVIRVDTGTPGAYARLGHAALAAGHLTRALEALQRAHDADSQDVVVLKNLWKIAQRRDDRVLQKTVLQKMIVLAPDDPEVHLLAESVEARQEQQTPAA